jgi:chemotaxis protein CheD
MTRAVTLVVPGVGSCVIVCAYHRQAKVAGMAHIVLPSSENFRGTAAKPFWFADRAIPHLLASLQAKGAVRPNCVVVGGANMFQVAIPSPQQDALNIGAMNVQPCWSYCDPPPTSSPSSLGVVTVGSFASASPMAS